jgi:hypothetical protein
VNINKGTEGIIVSVRGLRQGHSSQASKGQSRPNPVSTVVLSLFPLARRLLRRTLASHFASPMFHAFLFVLLLSLPIMAKRRIYKTTTIARAKA